MLVTHSGRTIGGQVLLSAAFLLTLAHTAPVEGAARPARAARVSRVPPKDSKLKALRKERLATLREVAAQARARYQAGIVGLDQVRPRLRAALDAELALCESDSERIRVMEKIVALEKQVEKNAADQVAVGASGSSELLEAKAARLEAEIALEQVRARTPMRAR